MAQKYVKIELKGKNKTETQTGQCLPSAVSVWEARGWTVVGDSEQEKPAPKTTSTGTAPSEKENA